MVPGAEEPAPSRSPAQARVERYELERQRILRAAFALIGRSAEETTSVHDILAAAGLSTRAFYRHFRSKDELVLTMYRTAADRLLQEQAEAIGRANDPAEALRQFIQTQLAVVYDPRRARQASVLSSIEARSADGFELVHQERAARQRTLLAEVLRAGTRQGQFPNSTDPEEDARAVLSVVSGVIDARLAGQPVPSWSEATEHTTALFERAFGFVPPQ